MEIIFATKNKGKIKEIEKIIEDKQLEAKVITMEEAGINIDVVEDGDTFEANAYKKAYEIMKASNKICMADDSGIEIDFLDKAPGVYSARYLGEDTPYIEKNKKILEIMKDVPFEKRTARFVSVITTCFPDGRVIVKRGEFEGYIHSEICGENGFGYDPIFFVPSFGKTSAELTMDEKNKVSHRGIAIRETIEELKKIK